LVSLGDRQSDVDPIEQRSRQLRPIELDAVDAARAPARDIAVVTARAGVRRRDEREPSRELDGTDHPRHDDTSVLERLP